RRCQSTHRLPVQRTRAANSTPRCWILGAQRMRTECNAKASMNHRNMDDRMTKAKPWARHMRLWMCLALLGCSVPTLAAAQETERSHDASLAEEAPAPTERSVDYGQRPQDVTYADEDVTVAYERAMEIYRHEAKDLDRTVRDIV